MTGEHRCEHCCKMFDTAVGARIHESRCEEKPRVGLGQGSRTAKEARRLKKAEKVKDQEKVKMGQKDLNYVFNFKYLGNMFQGDGDPLHAVEVRLARATARFNQMFNIWSSPALKLKVKLQLYQSAVCSIMSHGFECWNLSPAVTRKLNGWNSRCLSILTGRTVAEEAGSRNATPTFDLVSHLRVRRLQWVGHILRQPEERLLRKVVVGLEIRKKGSLLMDIPNDIRSMDDLIDCAMDRQKWQIEVGALRKQLNIECNP